MQPIRPCFSDNDIIYVSGNQIPHFEVLVCYTGCKPLFGTHPEPVSLLSAAIAYAPGVRAAIGTCALELCSALPLLLRIPFMSSKCQQA